MNTPAPGQTLPIPGNFPVRWDSPEEAARFWTADLMHWPNGLSVLSSIMDMPAFGRASVSIGASPVSTEAPNP